MQTLRKLLRGAREAVGLSQAQLAKAVGVSARTIGRLEACEEDVGFDVIASTRDVLETRGLTFLNEDDGEHWGMEFSLDLAPFPLLGAATNGLFHRMPGSVLRAARASLLASQEELSEWSGVAHTTVRRLERSDVSVTPSRAFKYQSYFQQTDAEIRPPGGSRGWYLTLRSKG
jgi:transcriptional regulator with XRE-family HTH domain